ncbi:MAG TPA: hypothetical protein VJT09_12065, partial [Pyrinomonadaceae bacterium]|nr:hypothetical protein [Pyrinomonadaceae bacterium]
MASEKKLLRALDLLTVAADSDLESLGASGDEHARKVKRIIATKNVVGVGISEKESRGRRT